MSRSFKWLALALSILIAGSTSPGCAADSGGDAEPQGSADAGLAPEIDAADEGGDAADAGERPGAGDAGPGGPDAGESADGATPAAVCGNGIVEAGEVCDDGNVEAGDGCDANCAVEKRLARFMTWNVQAEHIDWGGSAVEPRATALCGLLAASAALPDMIALQEFSPAWHEEANLACLRELGYVLALDDVGLYTEIAYRTGTYEIVESGTQPIASQFTGELVEKKTCVTWAVLRERESGKIFIPLSTHWDPNNGVRQDMPIAEIVSTLKALEDIRAQGARQSAELIGDLEARHPGAHIIYAGDFNTLDAQTIDSALALLSLFVDIDGTDIASAHETLGAESGLIDARGRARAIGLPMEDVSTASMAALPEGMAEIIQSLGIPIVIDFAFYSANLQLDGYEVWRTDAHLSVSDHFPVQVSLTYDAL